MCEDWKKQMESKEEEVLCAKEIIKELEENKCVLEKSWRDLELVNELLQKQIVLKELDVLHSKTIGAIQGKNGICIDT